MNNVYGVIYHSLGEAAEELQKQIKQNSYDKPQFYVAADLLFGDKLLSEWCNTEDPVVHIQKALNDNIQIFRDADTNGLGFLARIIDLGTSDAFVDGDGRTVLKIVQDDNGEPDMCIEENSLDTILQVLQISPLVFVTCIKSLHHFYKGEELS